MTITTEPKTVYLYDPTKFPNESVKRIRMFHNNSIFRFKNTSINLFISILFLLFRFPHGRDGFFRFFVSTQILIQPVSENLDNQYPRSVFHILSIV